MSTGQHRRTGEPLKDRLVKLVSAGSGSHRRRKQASGPPSIRPTIDFPRPSRATNRAEERSHGYQNGAAHQGTAA